MKRLLALGFALLLLAGCGGSGDPSAMAEGIQVHGHWAIEVVNPDGTVADRTEFENACADCDKALAYLLGKPGTQASAWTVVAVGYDPDGNSGFMEMWETGEHGSLERELALDGSGEPQGVVLRGVSTEIAPETWSDIDITVVHSQVFVDGASLPAFVPFTAATLAAPVHVVQGQQLLVTVTLTFS